MPTSNLGAHCTRCQKSIVFDASEAKWVHRDGSTEHPASADSSEHTSATRGAEDAARYYQGQDRRKGERRRSDYKTPGLFNRRRGERRQG